MNKTVIILTGPTASGKTSLAIQLAQQYRTAIISADSRQCFREMNIGVAKPDPQQLGAVKHYFINSHSIHENVNAIVFEQYALNAAAEIFKDNDVAIMAGGTGLYIKAFCEGLDPMPEIPPAIREQVISQYHANGIGWLQHQLTVAGARSSGQEMQNPQRMMRALEVLLATGKPIHEFQNHQPVKRDFNILKYGIDISREELHHNINARVDGMMEAGLLHEVQSLVTYRHLNALQTVGYAELFDYLDGKLNIAEAVERIKINTRQYAKRQLTWFKKDTSIQWAPSSRLLEAIRI